MKITKQHDQHLSHRLWKGKIVEKTQENLDISMVYSSISQ